MKDVRKWIVVRKKGVIDDFFRINDSFFGNNIGSRHGIFHEGKYESKVGENAFGICPGVMIAASVWLLLIPSIEMTEQAGGIAWIPACVGVTFAGVLIDNTGITLSGVFALALGIAIQNFPEGAIISMPLCRLLLFPGCLCGGQGFFCC